MVVSIVLLNEVPLDRPLSWKVNVAKMAPIKCCLNSHHCELPVVGNAFLFRVSRIWFYLVT